MKIQRTGYALKISDAFADILDKHLEGRECPATVNFRDPGYSPERGGYHPVEVRIEADGRISYVTDFAFCGGQFPELAKELDFDFGLGLFGHMGIDHPIAEGKELFAIFQDNFASYHGWGVFTVTAEEER
jgi:hypothetical protein